MNHLETQVYFDVEHDLWPWADELDKISANICNTDLRDNRIETLERIADDIDYVLSSIQNTIFEEYESAKDFAPCA